MASRELACGGLDLYPQSIPTIILDDRLFPIETIPLQIDARKIEFSTFQRQGRSDNRSLVLTDH